MRAAAATTQPHFSGVGGTGAVTIGVEPEIAAHGLTLYGIVSGWLFNPERPRLYTLLSINLLLDGLLDDSVPNPTATAVVHSDVAVPR